MPAPSDDRRARGAAAEAAVARDLEARGWRVVSRNYRCRLGEIDLIAREGETLVFLEVKHRRSARFGDGLEAVTPRKQLKIMSVAEWYLLQAPHGGPVRFDVAAVGPDGAITLVSDAFP